MKKILLFTPRYFEYQNIIVNRLRQLGNDVIWYDDRPSQSIFKKSILRVAPFFLSGEVNRYFDSILRKNKGIKYDLVLVILGQCFTEKILQKFKLNFPNAKFILYMRDSIKNFPNTLKIMHCFDICYSFDPDDCERYDFNFLPLFYSYSGNSFHFNESTYYDVSCICTIKKGKYLKLTKIKEACDLIFQRNYFYFYIQSWLVLLYLKLTCAEFKNTKFKNFKFKKLSYIDNLNIIGNSKIVIDVQMSNQSGLTMRTFETLALGKKLITTNDNIKKYDFYDKRLIYVLPKDMTIDFNDEFFKSAYQVDKNFMEKYSLDTWLKRMISGEEK